MFVTLSGGAQQHISHLDVLPDIARDVLCRHSKTQRVTGAQRRNGHPVADAAERMGRLPIPGHDVVFLRRRIFDEYVDDIEDFGWVEHIWIFAGFLHLGPAQCRGDALYPDQQMLRITDTVEFRLVIGHGVPKIEAAFVEHADVLFVDVNSEKAFFCLVVTDGMSELMDIGLTVGLFTYPVTGDQIAIGNGCVPDSHRGVRPVRLEYVTQQLENRRCVRH